MPSKYQIIHELWYEQSKLIASSPQQWMTFLKTASWVYKYSFEDQILIYAQKPNATACANYDYWNDKMNRWIKRGSKGIALLNNHNHSLRYVFDISDTRSPTNHPLKLWEIHEDDHDEFIEMINDKYNTDITSHDLGEAFISMAYVIAEDNHQDYVSSLLKYNEDSGLEFLEESEIRNTFKRLLAHSIAFELMNRCGIDTNQYFNEEDFFGITDFNTHDTIGQLGVSSRDLCDMAFKDISSKAREIHIRTFERNSKLVQNRDTENERSDLHERNRIQSSGRLPNAQPESGGTDLQQPLRKVEIQLSQTESSGTSVLTESQQQVEHPSQEDRRTGTSENGSIDGTIASETSRTEQGNESVGVGTAHEQPQSSGRGNRSQGNNLQLDLGLDIGGEDNTLPPFDLSDLPQLLREDISLQHSKQDIVKFFKEHTDDMERTRYIEECYDETLVETFRNPEQNDYSYIGYKKMNNQLHVWSGGFMAKKTESYLTFMQVQQEVAKLIDSDKYLLPRWSRSTGIQRAYGKKVINSDVIYQLFVYRNELTKSSSEIIAYFNEHKNEDERTDFIKDCYPNIIVEWDVDGVPLGFEKTNEHLHCYLGTYDNKVVTSDFKWDRVVREVDALIISRYFDPIAQIPTLEEQQNAIYENIEAFNNGIYFTQEEIDKVILRTSNHTENGKYRIYQHMLKHESKKSNADFVKNEFGTGGSHPVFGYIDEDHNSRGLKITRGKEIGFDEIKITLKWDKVAKRINELITLDRYLSPHEKEHYPIFLKEQMERQLEYERIMKERELGTYKPVIDFIDNGNIGNVEPIKDVPKDYKWKLGDTVHIGISEYTIIEDGETIVLQDNEFPLFTEDYPPEQFKSALKENPLNDHLLQPIEIIEEKPAEKTTKELYDEYLPIFVEKIKLSASYPALRDRDTSVDESNSLIRSEMISIIGSMNKEHPDIYNIFTTDDNFRNLMIDDIVGRTYEDIADITINSEQLSNTADERAMELYELFAKLSPHMADTSSAHQIFRTESEYDHPFTLAYDQRSNVIEMFHAYEINGIEVMEPYMKFHLDIQNKILLPYYYENPLTNLTFDLENNESSLNDEDVATELYTYTKTWLNNIADKGYYIDSEQVFKNDEKAGVYAVDYRPSDTIVYSDMPYKKLTEYANINHYKIAPSVREHRENSLINDILYDLRIEDIEITWDDDHQILAGDGDNFWEGKQFYDFLIDEAIVLDENNQPYTIDMEDYQELIDLSHTYDDLPINKVENVNKHNEIIKTEPINYHITDNNIGAGTPKERYRNNIAAIRLLFSLEKENRKATKEEQDILAKYVGWGGLADVFDETKGNWSNEYHELKSLLSDEEYANARESTLTAFYTPPVVIDSIYSILHNLGFHRGNILEPACGTGNFLGRLPDDMNESRLYGIELDSITGRIAKQLYQKANIAVEGYEKTNLPDSFFDVAIGNVPFGQFKVSDKRYDKLNFNIHDYFFAKTIDKVRPNGIIVFVTSRYTMDKTSSTVRKYINERAELLGAIRLPNTTFKESANTKAVSDILILQKRERPIVKDEDWLYTSKDDDGNIINSYFINNPDMVLGTLEKTKSMYGRDDITVVPFDDMTLKESLESAISNIHGQIDEYTLIDEEMDNEDNEIITIPADPTVRNFSYTLVDGDVYFRENSIMTKMELSKTAKNRTIGMIEIRDCLRSLIEHQAEDYPDDVIEKEQLRLNELFDSFTREYGLINSRGNSLAFRDDSSYYLLCSLENINEDGTLKSKADIFTKRTIRKRSVVTSVETSNEALLLSLAEKGTIDFDYMQSLTGFEKDKIIDDLHGVIYRIPDVLEENGDDIYVTADEYLSGNIREKLKIAKLSANLDPQYQHHVEALEKAMPDELSASEIDVRIGATWIEPEIYEQFMNEILSMSNFSKDHIHISYSKFNGVWNVSNKSWDKGNIKSEKTYGTRRANAYRLIEDCLNLKATKIFDYEYDDDGKKVAVLNKKETMIAQQKQDSIKDTFESWVWKDFDRREHLTARYNELFNSTRPRTYNGDHLEFPNMNAEITLRKHQKDAIAHILYGQNTLLAHVVGAGKTFEMIAACMELKRLGLSQKSLFVVPNHLIEQWGSEFLQLYPSANILVARKQDFEKSKRKKFCSRIATGDFDAIIIGHSQFEKIPVSAERQRRLIEEQIESITMGIQDLRANDGERYSIKQLERTKKGLIKRLDKLNSTDRKDDVITFEELGVDRLFVDEAHNYKNLFLYTKMRNVAGLAQTEAQKSSDLFMKCQYLDEITGGKGTVFATGTPISNSMTEMYTLQRYLQYNTLKERGLEHFDSWASTFGETVNAIELAPEGTGYKMKTRFAKFYNLPELINMFKEVADIKTADMLKLPVPTAHYHNVAVKPSDIQLDIVGKLAERAESVRNREVEPTVDNMLKITNDGRKLALDQRLINPLLPDNENSKVNACIDNVFHIWEENKGKKSTQLIFCDMSTPSKNSKVFIESLKDNPHPPYTNVYDDITRKLIERGVPASEIAYIHDATTDAQKKEMFAKVREGSIRVLLGSTQKMGAGTNVQDKLIAIHDLDCPWRPSDLEQRAGRIVRQGNTNDDVHIFRYVTEQTFDAYLYQLVENKQKFISQIMTSKSPVRSAADIDEVSLTYAEIKALASGNPLIKEKMDLEIVLDKLKNAKANYLSEKYDLEDRIMKYYPVKISKIEERIRGLTKDMESVVPADEFTGMTIKDVHYDEKEMAGNALLLACQSMKSTEPQVIGNYRGFEMQLSFDSLTKTHTVSLKNNLLYPVDLGTDVYGNITRLDNQIASIPKKLEIEQSLLADTKHQLEIAKVEVQKPFEKEEELQEKSKRLSEVDKELDINHKDDVEILDDIIDEDEQNTGRKSLSR